MVARRLESPELCPLLKVGTFGASKKIVQFLHPVIDDATNILLEMDHNMALKTKLSRACFPGLLGPG